MPVGRSVAKVATALGAYVSLAALISLALFPVRATGRADTIGRAQIFRGLDRPGLAAKDNENFGVPPDPTGAIGRRHYLEAVNSRLALFDASGLKQLRARDAYAFWGKSNTGQVVDPQVVWDDGARRWYYAALFKGGGDNDNEILLAWSKSSDPASASPPKTTRPARARPSPRSEARARRFARRTGGLRSHSFRSIRSDPPAAPT